MITYVELVVVLMDVVRHHIRDILQDDTATVMEHDAEGGNLVASPHGVTAKPA